MNIRQAGAVATSAFAILALSCLAHVAIEYRWAEGKYERFPALIGELIAVGVEVIVTAGTPATLA